MKTMTTLHAGMTGPALLAAVALLAASPAWAKGPSDVVRFFYEPVAFVADPQFRDMFVEPVRPILVQNDIASQNGVKVGCIDVSPAIDAQDFDEAELARSLSLSEIVSGEDAEVVASFRLFTDAEDAEREVVWSLRKVGDEWKIADLASITGGWRLSELECLP